MTKDEAQQGAVSVTLALPPVGLGHSSNIERAAWRGAGARD
jgi:hypothetical protein